MSLLNLGQRQIAVEAMRNWLDARKGKPTNAPGERGKTIDQEAKPLVNHYLAGEVSLEQFKFNMDGIGRRQDSTGSYYLWKFNGPGGQMFFNMFTNVAEDKAECDKQLKLAIHAPADDEGARGQIANFVEYVKTLGTKYVAAGGSNRKTPQPGKTAFFLSFFWQIHDRNAWPIYYNASVKQMIAMGLWQLPSDIGERYLQFKQLQEELSTLFSQESGQTFSFYDVEGVFWYRSKLVS